MKAEGEMLLLEAKDGQKFPADPGQGAEMGAESSHSLEGSNPADTLILNL